MQSQTNCRGTRFLGVGLIVAIAASVALAESGVDLVRHEMPELVRAVEGNLVGRRPVVEAIFDGWTSEDVQAFRDRTSLLAQVAAAGATPANELHIHRQLMGALGEVFGAVQLRKRFAAGGARVLDGREFGQLNGFGGGGRPDGIAYHVENGRLIVDSFLEAKMVTSRFAPAQARSFLDDVRKNGLRVLVDDGGTLRPRKFEPGQIDVSPKGAKVALANLPAETNLAALFSLVVSAKPREERFASVISFPVGNAELLSLSRAIIAEYTKLPTEERKVYVESITERGRAAKRLRELSIVLGRGKNVFHRMFPSTAGVIKSDFQSSIGTNGDLVGVTGLDRILSAIRSGYLERLGLPANSDLLTATDDAAFRRLVEALRRDPKETERKVSLLETLRLTHEGAEIPDDAWKEAEKREADARAELARLRVRIPEFFQAVGLGPKTAARLFPKGSLSERDVSNALVASDTRGITPLLRLRDLIADGALDRLGLAATDGKHPIIDADPARFEAWLEWAKRNPEDVRRRVAALESVRAANSNRTISDKMWDEALRDADPARYKRAAVRAKQLLDVLRLGTKRAQRLLPISVPAHTVANMFSFQGRSNVTPMEAFLAAVEAGHLQSLGFPAGASSWFTSENSEAFDKWLAGVSADRNGDALRARAHALLNYREKFPDGPIDPSELAKIERDYAEGLVRGSGKRSRTITHSWQTAARRLQALAVALGVGPKNFTHLFPASAGLRPTDFVDGIVDGKPRSLAPIQRLVTAVDAGYLSPLGIEGGESSWLIDADSKRFDTVIEALRKRHAELPVLTATLRKVRQTEQAPHVASEMWKAAESEVREEAMLERRRVERLLEIGRVLDRGAVTFSRLFPKHSGVLRADYVALQNWAPGRREKSGAYERVVEAVAKGHLRPLGVDSALLDSADASPFKRWCEEMSRSPLREAKVTALETWAEADGDPPNDAEWEETLRNEEDRLAGLERARRRLYEFARALGRPQARAHEMFPAEAGITPHDWASARRNGGKTLERIVNAIRTKGVGGADAFATLTGSDDQAFERWCQHRGDTSGSVSCLSILDVVVD